MCTTIERVRVEAGLSRPQMLMLLGAKPGRQQLFEAADDRVDPAFMARALRIKALYREWKLLFLERLWHAAAGGSALDLADVVALTGTTASNITALRSRGAIESRYEGGRYVFPVDAVRSFLEHNSVALRSRGQRPRRVRGYLARSFVAWCMQREEADK